MAAESQEYLGVSLVSVTIRFSVVIHQAIFSSQFVFLKSPCWRENAFSRYSQPLIQIEVAPIVLSYLPITVFGMLFLPSTCAHIPSIS